MATRRAKCCTNGFKHAVGLARHAKYEHAASVISSNSNRTSYKPRESTGSVNRWQEGSRFVTQRYDGILLFGVIPDGFVYLCWSLQVHFWRLEVRGPGFLRPRTV